MCSYQHFICSGRCHCIVLTVSLKITLALTVFFHCRAEGNGKGVLVSEVSGFLFPLSGDILDCQFCKASNV